MSIAVIKKRDGRIVPFDVKKIADTIEKSFRETTPGDSRAQADELAWEVTARLEREGNPAPTVESVQDQVEQVLRDRGHLDTAKRYILYRQARDDARSQGGRGRGTVVLEAWEPTLTGQALAICVALRNNGGAERLTGFYESLAPAAENELLAGYETLLALGFELLTGRPLAEKTLRTVRKAVSAGGLSPLGAERAWLTRQADFLCGSLGCDREPLEQAQEAAWRTAKAQTAARLRELLRCLHARGCTKDIISPPDTPSPGTDFVRNQED